MIAAWADLRPITDDSYEDNPLSVDPVCLKRGWAASQGDVRKSIDEWCGEVEGKTLKENVPNNIIYKNWETGWIDYWLSASYWQESKDSSCTTERQIPKDICVDLLNKAMVLCDPGSGDVHGASLTGKCIDYV